MNAEANPWYTGGIIALSLAMRDDLTIRDMKKTFIDLAHKQFGQRREGEMLSTIDPLKLTSKLMMLLRIFPSIYPSTPLRDGLVDLFSEETTLFSSIIQTKRQRATRVAVTSTKDTSASLCLIANYNRFSLQNSDDFEREDEDYKELKTWEAGLATSAAPLYFRPFKKAATEKDYVDGALHANFPATIALDEISKIWPGSAHLDILLSVGTGIQEKEYRIPSVAKIGGVEKIFAMFYNSLDTERSYKALMDASQVNLACHRIHRLNAHIQGGYIALDDHKKLEELERMVKNQVKGEGGVLHSLGKRIVEVADLLIANLFFLEPDEGTLFSPSLRDPVSPQRIKFFGSIRCRLAHESPELKQLVNKVDEFWLKEIVSANPGELDRDDPTLVPCTVIPLTDGQRSNIRMHRKRFRVQITITTFDPINTQQLIAVKLKGRTRAIPISGFPVTLQELQKRMLLH